MRNKCPEYDFVIEINPENILKNGFFSVGRSFIKAIFCIYQKQGVEWWKAPSNYMLEFGKSNSNLPDAMKSHLIGDLDKFGIKNDNFDTFLTERTKLLAEDLKNR